MAGDEHNQPPTRKRIGGRDDQAGHDGRGRLASFGNGSPVMRSRPPPPAGHRDAELVLAAVGGVHLRSGPRRSRGSGRRARISPTRARPAESRVPCRAPATRRPCTNSIAPTSSPRSADAATSTRRSPIDLAGDTTSAGSRPTASATASGCRHGRRTPAAGCVPGVAIRRRNRPRRVSSGGGARAVPGSRKVNRSTRPRRWRSSAIWATPLRRLASAPPPGPSLPPSRCSLTSVHQPRQGFDQLPSGRCRRPRRCRRSRPGAPPSTGPGRPPAHGSSFTCRSRTVSSGRGSPASSRPVAAPSGRPSLGQALLGGALGRLRRHRLAPPQHRDPIGDLEHLAQLVADEDDRGALLASAS